MALLEPFESGILAGKEFIKLVDSNIVVFKGAISGCYEAYLAYCEHQEVPCNGFVFAQMLRPLILNMPLVYNKLQGSDILDDDKRSYWGLLLTKLVIQKLYPRPV